MKIGIVGAGQLGRMLGLAAIPLGVSCRFLDTSTHSPARAVGEMITGALDDSAAILELAEDCDVVTFEIENVSPAALETVSEIVPIHPSVGAITTAQDRLAEKRLFESLDIPTASYLTLDDTNDLEKAAKTVNWPVVVKTRRLGYDGRGQRVANSAAELSSAWAELGQVPAIIESWIAFEYEVSLIAVRGASHEIGFYGLSRNTHVDGILSTTIAPHDEPQLQATAERWLTAIMEHFDYRGVLAVEFFVKDGALVANEIAPRVHNSGHWTIEGAVTSQFENHIRAIAGWPLGDTSPNGHAAMVNLIGRMPSHPELLAVPGLHLHDYGKSPRPARKLGHCTLVDQSRHELDSRLAALLRLVKDGIS